MYARAARAYQNVYLESASPARILNELYLRLRKDIQTAQDRIKTGNLVEKGEAIGHAIAIVGQLRAALDFKVSPELCGRLAMLYDFLCNRLTLANARNDVKPLHEADSIVATLHDAFQQAAALGS